MAACFSLGAWFFAGQRVFRLAARFSFGGAVFARRYCFLLGLGFFLSTDFGSWLLPVAARSGLCSLSFPFLSPFSFTELKILLTTGFGYCLPYIQLGNVFFTASWFSLGADLFSAARFSLGGAFFAWQLGFRSAGRFSLGGVVFVWRRGFRLAVRFSLGGAVFARRCCFLLGLGFFLSTDFGSWLLPVVARSGLCSLSFLFLSLFSFTELKILLTTGLGYCLPYIILGKVFFTASRFSLGAGLLSAARFSLNGAFFARQLVFRSAPQFLLATSVFARRLGFRSAARFSLGGAVFARRRGFRSAAQFSLGSAVFSWGWSSFSARILVPGCYLQQPGVVCVPFLSFSNDLYRIE